MLCRLRWLALAWAVVSSLVAVEVRAEVDPLRGARISHGELVWSGEAFLAGPEGAIVTFEHGSELQIAPETRLRFLRHQKLHLGSGPDPMYPTRVVALQSGSVAASTPPAKRFAVLLIGPGKLQSILSSGQLKMIARQDRAAVAAYQGTVLVTLAEKWRRLPAGMTQVVSENRPQGYRRAILGAPQAPVASRRLLVEGQGADSSTTLTWPALPGAVAYEAQLFDEAGAMLQKQRVAEPRAALSSLPAGSYRLTTRGIDDSGLSGAPSQAIALNVVGLQLPETASRGADGAIRLQPGQRVSLVGAEGLEVSYLGGDEFLPVPRTLGLVARRPISLTLRHGQSGDTLGLNLEPMSVKAEVFFARQPNAWPAEGLDISVELVDARGYPIPDNFQVACRVTVNVAPVSPTWQRQGSSLRTSLERPEGPGPWMVRVDVLDESGASLGMDFAEVGYRAAPAQAARR